MQEYNITEGLSKSVWSSLDNAIESNSPETILSFISFFRKMLRESLYYHQIATFTEFISFPVVIYSKISYQQKQNQTKGERILMVSEQMSLHLKEIVLLIDLGAKGMIKTNDLNKYYYEAFRSYSNLFYQNSRFQDWNVLASSLRRYGQVVGILFRNSDNKKNRLEDLRSKNGDESNKQEIQKLNSEIKIQDQFNELVRHPLAALKYWLYLLYNENILSQENLDKLIKIIYETQVYNPNTEIQDIFFFRTSDLRRYMGWENWDFTERPEHEMYEPPTASKWMTYGFVLDRIRTKNSYFILSDIDSKLKSTIPFFFDDVKKYINRIRTNFHKWQKVLHLDNIEDYDIIAENLLSSIAFAKRDIVGIKEIEISLTPLSRTLVEMFKLQMGLAWQNQTRIRRIFDYFGNLEDVTEKDVLLKRVGTNNLLERGKIHFIDGENQNNIYGLDHFGASVGRWENNLFLNVIEKSGPMIIEGKSLLVTLDEIISQFHRNNIVPTAIILEPEYLYKDDQFLQSDRYSGYSRPEYNPDSLNFFVLGEFDGIPLFAFYSPELRDKIVVSNFKDAFMMYYKKNKDWYKNELSVKVDEVSEEIVNKKYNSNPDKWLFTDDGIELSEADAKLLIKNSVIIDIETIMDFKVLDKSKFIIGHITEPIND